MESQAESKMEDQVQVDHLQDSIPETAERVHVKPTINLSNVLFVLVISSGMVTGGSINGMIATTLAQPSFSAYFGLTKENSISRIGVINGIFYAGGFLGVFFGAWSADRFGRRRALALNCVLSAIWMALLAGSVNISMFIVMRFFSGFNASQFITLVPLYNSEIAAPHLRGLLVGMSGMGNLVGYEIASWSGVGFYYAKGSGNQWRWPFVILAGLCLITLSLLYFTPESPRWLLMKGRRDEAEAVVRRIHTSTVDRDGNFAALELIQMERQLEEERSLSISYMQMFTNKQWRRRSLLCCLVGLLGQCTGVLVINNYGPFFYSVLGMAPIDQLYLSAGYVTVSFVFAVLSVSIVDRVGRVKLMAWGTIGQVACLIIEAAIVANVGDGSNLTLNRAGIAIFYVYIAIYAVSWDCTQFTYVAELMPTHLRAKGVTLAIACLYLSDVGFLTATLYAFTNIGWKFFLVFICISPPLVALLFIYAPETKGKTLEEIGGLFGDKMAVESLDQLGAEMGGSLNQAEKSSHA